MFVKLKFYFTEIVVISYNRVWNAKDEIHRAFRVGKEYILVVNGG